MLVALLCVPVLASAARRDECLLAWRVTAATVPSTNVRITCHDGEACDLDGTADGTCTLSAQLCVNVAGCTPGVVTTLELGGRDAPVLAPATTEVTLPAKAVEACSHGTPMRLVLDGRRSAKLSLTAMASAEGRDDRDALRVVCKRARSAASRAVVVTTNFETGALATVRTAPPRRVSYPSSTIAGDAVIRTLGDRVVVLNRFLADNVQILDPSRGMRTVLQCSTGAATNPHDIALIAPDKAYVTRYDVARLLIVDPSAGGCGPFTRGTIDLGAQADADGLPEMNQVIVDGSRAFVTIQRLNRRRLFEPTGPGRVVVIDTATDAVVTVLELAGANPFGDASGIVREPGTGKLVVGSVGEFGTIGDGGLQRIDPSTLTVEPGFFVSEDALGGDITDFVLVSATRGYAIVQARDERNLLMRFDPSGVEAPVQLLSRSGFLPDVAIAPDGAIWVADQTLPAPGLRVFDPVTGEQMHGGVVDVGLPPFSMGFVP
jgi:hypothetical protein